MDNHDSCIYYFDLCRISPYLRILNKDYYQTKLSLTISFIIILFSIFFASYSIYDYINQTPNIDYYKLSDNSNKTIYLNDIFIAFNFKVYNESMEKDIDIVYSSYYHNGIDIYSFPIERCKLGKNIDFKFKDLVENYNKNAKLYIINDYYCINYNNTDIVYPLNQIDEPLFYIFGSYSKNVSENLSAEIFILTENDLLDNTNKENPISKYYNNEQINFAKFNYDINLIYEFQYIKYRTDNGVFFQKPKDINAIQFSKITDKSDKGGAQQDLRNGIMLELEINKIYYDYYYRSYQKLQSAIADILTTINLIFSLGSKISFFILNKYMCKDIIKELVIRNDISQREYHKSFHLNRALGPKNITKKNEEKSNNINSKTILKKTIKIGAILSTNLTEKIKHTKSLLQSQKQKFINKINYLDVFKNIICCCYKQNKLYEICNKIFNEDICIDKILRRIYKLERLYDIIPKQRLNKIRIDENKRFKEIDNYISKNFDKSKKIKKKN